MTIKLKPRAFHLILTSVLFAISCAPIESTAPTPQVAAPVSDTQTSAAVDPAIANEAAQIAGAFGRLIDENLGSLRITDTRAEGNTAIIENRIIARRTRVEPSRTRRELRSFVCGDPNLGSFVNRGGSLRFEIAPRSNGSGNLTSITISSC